MRLSLIFEIKCQILANGESWLLRPGWICSAWDVLRTRAKERKDCVRSIPKSKRPAQLQVCSNIVIAVTGRGLLCAPSAYAKNGTQKIFCLRRRCTTFTSFPPFHHSSEKDRKCVDFMENATAKFKKEYFY